MITNADQFLLASTYKNTRLPVEQATTLPPVSYRCDEFYKLEAQKLMGCAWACVGYVSELDEPGKMFPTTVGGQPIVITKNKSGELKGFFNVCRHRGSILVSSAGQAERFRCPYHSWTYDLDGNLQNCPLFIPKDNGEGKKTIIDKNDYGLLPIKVQSYGPFIFVNLSSDAEPLSDYLGDMPSQYKNFPLNELVLVRRKNYHIKANWKLIAENFLEYYHLPWVHPELCEVTSIQMHKRNQGAGMYMSFYASPLLKGGTALDADQLPPMPGLNEEEQNSGYFPFIFPNLAMFILPHHLFALIMNPLSSHETQEYGDLLVHKDILNAPNYESKIDEIFSFYDMVNQQDIEAVERVQLGIQATPYQGGRMSHRFEEPVHRFQNMVIDFMTNERKKYAGD